MARNKNFADAANELFELNEEKEIEVKEYSKDEGKKFQKSIVWDAKMKPVLEKEAKKRGMTVAGFIKYCVAKEIND